MVNASHALQIFSYLLTYLLTYYAVKVLWLLTAQLFQTFDANAFQNVKNIFQQINVFKK